MNRNRDAVCSEWTCEHEGKGRWEDWENEIDRYTLPCIKQMASGNCYIVQRVQLGAL